MTKPLATRAQMLRSKLANPKPILCEVCERFIGPRVGIPVIMDERAGIIRFIHATCCAENQ